MLKAASYMVLCHPTSEKTALIIATNAPAPITRSVVLHVGCGVNDDIEPGDVLHYTGYHEIGESHVVPHQHVVAIETER